MEPAKNPTLSNERDGEEPLSIDTAMPPAPVDVHAFTRRAGEIIARAARSLQGKRVKR
jgi:hypothetical protein